MLRFAFLVLLLITTSTHAASLRDDVRAWRVANEPAIVTELRDLLAIPNLASDAPNIERNAAAIEALMRKRGIETTMLRVDGAPPVVFGEIRTPGAKETLILYAHYDGQPVDPSRWASPPWQPVIRNDSVERGGREIPWSEAMKKLDPEWRIFARAASDDKAPIIAMLAAVDALRASKRALRTNAKFFFEGEEEASSPHLGAILEKHRDLLRGDLWLIADGPVHQSRRLQLYYGVRGVMGLEVTTYGPLRPLHSGHYGNWAPNPIVTLAHLIASLRDESGKILIDGFYDDVRPLTAAEREGLAQLPPVEEALRNEVALGRIESEAPVAERVTLPALNLRGIRSGNVGESAANVISTEAQASIDFRLVPNQTPEMVRTRVEDHLRKRGWHVVHQAPDAATRRQHPRVVRLEWEEGYPAARVPFDHPLAMKVARRIESVLGQKLIKLPTLGGSVPLYLFVDKLQTAVLGVPIVNHDNNQHGHNENLRLQNLWDGIEVFAAILGGD